MEEGNIVKFNWDICWTKWTLGFEYTFGIFIIHVGPIEFGFWKESKEYKEFIKQVKEWEKAHGK